MPEPSSLTPENQENLPLLYDYWRSTACYRVRIALNLKGIDYRAVSVNLVRDGGEQHQQAYRALNPEGLVPALRIDGQVFSQSLAICEYLEETRPQPALLPQDAALRSQARALALAIACDIHPINNLRVQQYLKGRLAVPDADAVAWMNHWMSAGFAAIEARLTASNADNVCVGTHPGLADCFLVPQVYNADRFGCDMSPYPLINQIVAHCRALPAFQAARPEVQPDAPDNV